MPLSYHILTEDDVLDIKQRLWNGETQEAIAQRYKVAQRTISDIRRGATWIAVEWPDKKTGAMSQKRAAEIHKLRRVATAALRNPIGELDKRASRKRGKK